MYSLRCRYPRHGDYDLDVAGIGQEADGSNLIAQSVGLELNGTAFLADNGDYVLIGHRVPQNQVVTADLPADVTGRWARDWALDRTDGGVSAHGSLTLTFDFAGAGLNPTPGLAAGYRLLYRSGPSGDFTALSGTATVAAGRVAFVLPAAAATDGVYTLGSVDLVTSSLGQVLFAKAVDQTRVTPGQVVMYTLHYASVSPITLTDVIISDSLPSDLAILSQARTPALTQLSGPPDYAWQVGELASVGGLTPIAVTFNADLDFSAVTSRTFNVQAGQNGLVPGDFAYDPAARRLIFSPARDLYPNDVVRVSALAGLRDTAGHPLQPFQWQFSPGVVADCASGAAFSATYTLNASAQWWLDAGDYDNDGDLDLSYFYRFLWIRSRSVSPCPNVVHYRIYNSRRDA